MTPPCMHCWPHCCLTCNTKCIQYSLLHVCRACCITSYLNSRPTGNCENTHHVELQIPLAVLANDASVGFTDLIEHELEVRPFTACLYARLPALPCLPFATCPALPALACLPCPCLPLPFPACPPLPLPGLPSLASLFLACLASKTHHMSPTLDDMHTYLGFRVLP